MSAANTSCEQCSHNKIAREDIYLKLSLLARLVAHMGSEEHYHLYEDEDFCAMELLLDGVAREIYPEWRKLHQQPTGGEA